MARLDVEQSAYRVAVLVLTAERYSVVTAGEYMAASETIARHLALCDVEKDLGFGDRIEEIWIVE